MAITNIYPATDSITIVQGQKYEKTIRWKVDRSTVRDLGGYTFDFLGKTAQNDTGAGVTLLTSEGGSPNCVIAIDGDGSAGELTLLITASETAALDFEVGWFRIKASHATKISPWLLKGKMFLEKGNT